jgi:hypothetical protein
MTQPSTLGRLDRLGQLDHSSMCTFLPEAAFRRIAMISRKPFIPVFTGKLGQRFIFFADFHFAV